MKMAQLGSLAAVVSRTVEMRSVRLRRANLGGNIWLLQILLMAKGEENVCEVEGLVYCREIKETIRLERILTVSWCKLK